MSILIFGNNDSSVLAAPINNSVTTLTLFPGAGPSFPHPAANQYFVMTLQSQAGGSDNEIVWVTNVTGDVCTIIRGQEGTTPQSWLAGDFASCYPTAGTQASFIQPDQLQEGVYEIGVAAGTANALVATIHSDLTSVPNGMRIVVTATATNTASPTLAITLGTTSLSPVNIYKNNQEYLVPGDIQNGANLFLIYNSTYGGWVLQNPLIYQGGALVGDARNLVGNLFIAGKSITFTATQIALQSLSGVPLSQSVILNSYSHTLNLNTVGAGGMDVGSPPTNGFVGIYAIFNPLTGSVSILATNASISLSDVYSGAHLPSGYTFSALMAVWPTDSSGNLIVGVQNGRELHLLNQLVLSTNTFPITALSLSVASIVPLNAQSCSGLVNVQSTSGSGVTQFNVSDEFGAFGGGSIILGNNAKSSYTTPDVNNEGAFYNVRTDYAQVIILTVNSASGAVTAASTTLFIWGYTI